MFVKPGPDKTNQGKLLIVRMPNRQILPAAGMEVPDDAFWQGRLRDGDVVAAVNPAAADAAAAVAEVQEETIKLAAAQAKLHALQAGQTS